MKRLFRQFMRLSLKKEFIVLSVVILFLTAFSTVGSDKIDSRDNFYEELNSKEHQVKNQQLDDLLSNAYDQGRFNGNVLYAEKGTIIYNRQFGYENFKTRKPLSDTSVFQMASTSKPFTAIAILHLNYQGKINIDDNVNAYLPDFPYPEITVKQLLQHRSGLPDYTIIADRYWDKRKTMHNADITPLLKKRKAGLTFTPGSKFRYCNTNYAYLALIVEKVSKKSFDKYMQSEIFDKIGMRHTFIYSHDKRNNKQAVTGYSYSKKRGFYERPCDFLDGVVGDKDLYSTVNDLFLFDQALYNDKFIDPKMMELAFTPAEPFDETHNRDYGLGFRLKIENGQEIAYHHGWWKGFRTYYIHDYSNNRTLIWLNNRSDVHITDYMAKIMNMSIDEESSSFGGN